MINLRKSLAIALTVATLGLGAIADAPTASAHGFGGGHFRFHPGRFHPGRFHPGRFHYHWHHRFGFGGGFHWHHRWGYGWGVGHRWGGYRRIVEVGGGEAPRLCPIGEHRGYLGKYCWPNRR